MAAEKLGAYLTGTVTKGGQRYPAGTKVSDLDLTDEEKARLERLELTGSKKDAEAADAEASSSDDSE